MDIRDVAALLWGLVIIITIIIIAVLILPLESSVASPNESARMEIMYDTNRFGRR